jgi:alkaline phosphatase
MTKAGYVDGFVLVVPKKNAAKYKKLAADGRKTWLKFGALDYKECVMDDPNAQMATTFAKIIKPKADEQVWFSFVTYKSKADRKQINKKVMDYFSKKYPQLDMEKAMPFDMNRMATAGFKVVVG